MIVAVVGKDGRIDLNCTEWFDFLQDISLQLLSESYIASEISSKLFVFSKDREWFLRNNFFSKLLFPRTSAGISICDSVCTSLDNMDDGSLCISVNVRIAESL